MPVVAGRLDNQTFQWYVIWLTTFSSTGCFPPPGDFDVVEDGWSFDFTGART